MSEVIPEGWQCKALAEIVSLQYGKSPKEVICQGGAYPVLGTGGITGYASDFLHEGETTVIGRKGTIDKPSFITGKFWAIDTTYFATQYKQADPKWFYYALSSLDLAAFNEASGVPSLNRDTLYAIPLSVPPIPEQQKIATILSSVDNVIEKTRAQIDKLKNLKTGMMQELLTQGIGHKDFEDSPLGPIPKGWELCQMNDLFDFKNGVNKGKEAFGHGAPIISYKNVYSGGGIFDHQITDKVQLTRLELPRFSVEYGDVFFTRTSETQEEIGLSNVYLGSKGGVVFNGFVIRGRQKKEYFDAAYLKYAFLAPAVRHQMIANSKFTTRAGISGEALGKIVLSVPPLVEQNKIAQTLNSIDFSMASTLKNLKKLNSLKKALMQDLLTGKVRVELEPTEVAAA